jgi:hypothetical protein
MNSENISERLETRASRAFRIAILVLFGIPGALVVVVIVGFAINAFFDARAGRAFEKIEMGASAQTVIAALGTPSTVRPCGKYLWWGGDGDYRGENDGRCVTEARYEYFLSAWGVGYSKDARVVSKYHYFSE